MLVAVAFFCSSLAGTAATLFSRARPIAEDEPDPDEADERLVTAADMLVVRAAFDEMLVRKGPHHRRSAST